MFATLGASALAASPAYAGPTLVELFVSQNCKACPAAHKTLSEISEERDDFVLLTWSVDYWDYLGEADPLALPMASNRQRDYAESMGLRGPYTPQTVYNGETHCPGNRHKAVSRELDEHAAMSIEPISLAMGPEGLSIRGSDLPASDVFLVHYRDVELGGEQMRNVVTSFRKLGTWSGGPQTLDISCTGSCIVLVQEQGHGEVFDTLLIPQEEQPVYTPILSDPSK